MGPKQELSDVEVKKLLWSMCMMSFVLLAIVYLVPVVSIGLILLGLIDSSIVSVILIGLWLVVGVVMIVYAFYLFKKFRALQ